MNYLLKNPSNYRIARAVRDAWPGLIEQIAAQFLKELEQGFGFADPWVIKGIAREELMKAYALFSVSKLEWGDRYSIAMQFQDPSCGNLWIGIQKSASMPHIASLHSKLAEKTGHSEGPWTDWVWGATLTPIIATGTRRRR